MLNKHSGLLGISGISNDMRTICEHADQGHEAAQLALDVFCFRAAKHIAAMMVSLSHCDALVFTGGIGENSAVVRNNIIAHLNIFDFHIDANQNINPKITNTHTQGYSISKANSKAVLVIPTDEEGMIVQDTLSLISSYDQVD